jgi:hypothetical protein
MIAHVPASSLLTAVALIPLVAWRMYARFKRLVGKQRFSYARPWISLSIFPLITVFLGLATKAHPERLWLLAAGAVLGVGLGLFGLQKTKFEVAADGLYYTPNAHLGIALSAVMFARIIYRAFQVAMTGPDMTNAMGTHAATPLTLAIFGVLAGYYVSYAIGLLRWHSTVARKDDDAPTESAEA